MTQDKASLDELKNELEGIEDQIRNAIRAGDSDSLIALESRKRVLPVLIRRTKIEELESKIPALVEKCDSTHSARTKAYEAFKKAEEAAKAAEAERDEARRQWQISDSQENMANRTLNGVQASIAQLNAEIEEHVTGGPVKTESREISITGNVHDFRPETKSKLNPAPPSPVRTSGSGESTVRVGTISEGITPENLESED